MQKECLGKHILFEFTENKEIERAENAIGENKPDIRQNVRSPKRYANQHIEKKNQQQDGKDRHRDDTEGFRHNAKGLQISVPMEKTPRAREAGKTNDTIIYKSKQIERGFTLSPLQMSSKRRPFGNGQRKALIPR